MVRMAYRCESCGRAFAHEPDAKIHALERGHSYEVLADA